eukprot:1633257-Rhodomonas_salina.1
MQGTEPSERMGRGSGAAAECGLVLEHPQLVRPHLLDPCGEQSRQNRGNKPEGNKEARGEGARMQTRRQNKS